MKKESTLNGGHYTKDITITPNAYATSRDTYNIMGGYLVTSVSPHGTYTNNTNNARFVFSSNTYPQSFITDIGASLQMKMGGQIISFGVSSITYKPEETEDFSTNVLAKKKT